MHDLPMPGKQAAILLSLILLIRGITYIAVVPLWQAPDEPSHLEYAMLMGRLDRPPTFQDEDASVEQAILRSMGRHDFWRLVGEKSPETTPTSFRQVPFLRNSGTQLGNEPPLYYIVPAVLSRLAGGNVDSLAYAVRGYSLLLLWLTFMVSLWGEKRLWPDSPEMAWAFPLFLALAPMSTFVGVSINDDSLAMLTGALAITLWALWVKRRGGVRLFVAATAALLLAILSKRTCLFLIPAALLALPMGLRAQRRWAWGAVVAFAVVAAAVVLVPNPHWAAWWQWKPGPFPATRVPADGGHALLVRDEDTGTRPHLQQKIPATRLCGRNVTLSARVRSTGGTVHACLLLDDGTIIEEKCCPAGSTWSDCTLSHVVSPKTEFLRVVLATGRAGHPEAVGDWEAKAVSLRGGSGREWLRNGDAEEPASLAYRWLSPSSYTPFWLRRYAVSLGILFSGFWGDFGWLQHPLRLAWYVLLAVGTVAAIVGASLRLFRDGLREDERRLMLWLLLAAMAAFVQVLAPMIGSEWRPQGRYLFPALLPIAAWMLWGLGRWMPRRRKEHVVYFWIVLFFVLDMVSLIEVIYPAYHPIPPGWWIG